MSTTVARRIVVHGRVQGVGFRESALRAAAAVGVQGHVRNRHDGTVEIHVQGASADVERFVAWCRRGPPAARVGDLFVEPAVPDPALARFERRPTG